MEKMKLSEIAECLGTTAPIECDISVISTDTRTLPKGCLFLALKGERFDGHEYINKAIEEGAAAAVSEKPIEGCPCIVVKSTRQALLDIAKYYRSKFKPILIGVTGSVGKTTTKEMTALVLSEKYKTLKTGGNLNNEIGMPKTLFQLDDSFEAAVIEMGMNHFGEMHRLATTSQPTFAMITNIGFSHVENLGSQEGILKAKSEIFDGMSDDAPLLTNGDDKLLAPLKEKLSRPVYLYGIENENCDFRAVDIKETNDSTTFTVKYKDGSQQINMPCVGVHNVMNACGAFAVGVLNGVTAEEAARAIAKYQPEGMRQRIEEKDGKTLIIDCYNASPDSMKAALSVLSGMKTQGRKIAVLGDMLELGDASEKLHRLVGEYVSEYKPDMLYTYGEEGKFITDEAQKNGITAFAFGKDEKDTLCEKLKETVNDGDCILFKASRGMKLEEVIDKIF